MAIDVQTDETLGLIADALERLIAGHWQRQRLADPQAVRAMQEPLWAGLGQARLLAPWLPEALGGDGLGVGAMAPMAQAVGRHLVRLPLLGNLVMAGAALSALGVDRVGLGNGQWQLALAVAEPGQSHGSALRQGALCASRATPDARHWRLRGTKAFVIDALAADALLVSVLIDGQESAGPALFLVDRALPGLQITSYPTLEGSELATVSMVDVPCTPQALIASGPMARWALDLAGLQGSMWAAAETLGACDAAFEQTLAYLRVREQFGRPLASFQALQHRAADLFAEIELLRSQCAAATVALAALRDEHGLPATRARIETAAAAALAADVGRLVAREAIQLHGAIGMTEDLGIGRYLMRIDFLWQLLGRPAEQHEQIVGQLLESIEAFDP